MDIAKTVVLNICFRVYLKAFKGGCLAPGTSSVLPISASFVDKSIWGNDHSPPEQFVPFLRLVFCVLQTRWRDEREVFCCRSCVFLFFLSSCDAA